MDTLPSRKASGQTPPSAAPLPEPRGKLEFMFRTMLVEAHQITERSEKLVKQLDAAAMQLQTLPAVLRKASAAAQDQATSRAARQIQEAASQVQDAHRLLKRTAHAMAVQHSRNLWTVGLAALACSVVGGLVAALVLLFALK